MEDCNDMEALVTIRSEVDESTAHMIFSGNFLKCEFV